MLLYHLTNPKYAIKRKVVKAMNKLKGIMREKM